jgi:hypothetical protein
LIKKEKNKLTGEALNRAIKTACGDLVFISEIDSDVRAVFLKNTDSISIDHALALLAGSQKTMMSERPADDFFDRLTTDRNWHGRIEHERVLRFRILRELLAENLTGIREYRLGKTRLTIFVIGYDDDGNIAGITTNAVET